MLLLAIALAASAATADALPNDNRTAAGRVASGVLTVRIVAEDATFHPETMRGPAVAIFAFAEEGRAPSIPGPLIRATAGSDVRVAIRNALPAVLCVRGLQDHSTSALDTTIIAAGATREVRFRANTPGTFLYWARTGGCERGFGTSEDSQLAGALVVDPPGQVPRPHERIMVVTAIDDSVVLGGERRRRQVFTINGLSWPWTERLHYTAGDTVRWRVINASSDPHPMHLHGFYFEVTSKGDTVRDTVYTTPQRRKAVTEFMLQGTTMSMTWVPTRPGNWLFHCHLIYHIASATRLMTDLPPEEAHNHALSGMAGLVMGIEVVPRPGTTVASAPPPPRRRLRLYVTETPNVFGANPGFSFVQQEGDAAPAADSLRSPSSTIILHRGEPTEIVVLNRMRRGHASVHWHGIEVDSYYDGVGGWSGAGTTVAPVIAPGDSFVVRMTPDRAGTFIYHTHVDEGAQLTSGLYGPLLVLAPGAEPDTSERIILIGDGGPTETPRTPVAPFINGSAAPPPIELRSGVTHRVRFVSISGALVRRMRLVSDSGVVRWRAVAKDGADLPPNQASMRDAVVALGPGETADFEVRRDRPETLTLEVVTAPAQKKPHLMKIPVIVR